MVGGGRSAAMKVKAGWGTTAALKTGLTNQSSTKPNAGRHTKLESRSIGSLRSIVHQHLVVGYIGVSWWRGSSRFN